MKRAFLIAVLAALSIASAVPGQSHAQAIGQATGSPAIGSETGLPLRVTGEFGHWRRIEDYEGRGGWIHYSLLSGVRTVLVTTDMTPMRSAPRDTADEVAVLERDVVGRIIECQPAWCRLNVEGTRGWVERGALWGLDPNEVLD